MTSPFRYEAARGVNRVLPRGDGTAGRNEVVEGLLAVLPPNHRKNRQECLYHALPQAAHDSGKSQNDRGQDIGHARSNFVYRPSMLLAPRVAGAGLFFAAATI